MEAGNGRVSWFDSLDPVRNLKAITDPRSAGRRIVEDYAEQLLTQLNGYPGPSGGDHPGPSGPDDLGRLLRQLRADAARAGEVSASLIEHSVALLSTLAGRMPGPSGRSGQRPGDTPLLLGPVAPGGEATEVFWVHNTGPVAVPSVRPHCGPLRSHTGTELEPAVVRFDPPLLDPLPPRSSCGIEVRVGVPERASPGTYASVILASNAPDWYLPISVRVAPTEAAPGPDAV